MHDRIRVLHILLNLHYGGVETFAINLLRSINRKRYDLDFALVQGSVGVNEAEAKELGANIFRYRRPGNAPGFLSDLDRIMKENGPYDVIHSHLGLPNALVMLAAHRHSIAVRIAHAHSTLNLETATARLASAPLKASLSHASTRRLAVSPIVAESHYGPDWNNDPKVGLIPCGVDLGAVPRSSRHELREKLNLPNEALVLVSTGRLVPIKNQAFLLHILQYLQAFQPSYLLLIGDGPMREPLASTARSLGLTSKVRIPGRLDTPDLIEHLHASDVFALPSFSEGLSMSAIEAQGAGLPCVLSTGVPKEAAILPELTSFLNLTEGPSAWAEAVQISFRRGKAGLFRSRRAVDESGFSISSATRRLESLYEAQLKEAHQ